MTNREMLVKEFNANPDKYLYFYNCVLFNGESDCTKCVIVNSTGNKNCRVAYTRSGLIKLEVYKMLAEGVKKK